MRSSNLLLHLLHHLLQVFLSLLFLPSATPFSIGNNNHAPPTFQIERVTTIEQVLDVLSFRAQSIRHGCDAIDDDESNVLFRQKIRDRMPQSIQRFEVGGGTLIQFLARMMSSNTSNNGVVVVGAVDVRYCHPEGALPSRVHLKNLKVRHGYRRKGIGTALLKAVEDMGRTELDAQAVTLIVERKQNPTAVRLYERVGFVLQEDIQEGFMIQSFIEEISYRQIEKE
ncbi:expressed unknown protein [Seminavis robusta]|uniref:N-acetyltransferase domain-containing protein n=1 Tax=Seminavis robusta TaxID=568900 RepID=A0A9N8HCH3_9STRA|nr:expressed unknown protein [Seminavis robusta]|eukprot:Sro319_g116170.1 n/a (226) ;mRNA; r:15648-16325